MFGKKLSQICASPCLWFFFDCLLSCKPSGFVPVVCLLSSFFLSSVFVSCSFFTCLFLAFLEVSNKRNYTLIHIPTSIYYLQLKYYKILLLYLGKSFLLNHCSHILVSPWRSKKWSRFKTHKQIIKKNPKPTRGRNHTSL